MAITVASVTSEFDSFFQNLASRAATEIVAWNVPIIGAIGVPVASALLQTLSSGVASALGALGPNATGQEIADALNDVPGIDAFMSGGELRINLTGAGDTVDLGAALGDLASVVADVGLVGEGAFNLLLNSNINIQLALAETGGLTVFNHDQGDDLSFTVAGSISANTEATLGFLDVTITDHNDADPELTFALGVDLAGGTVAAALAGLTADADTTAKLDLDVTVAASDFLPSISSNLIVDFSSGTPESAFNDITVDIGTMFGLLAEALEVLDDILDIEPIKTFLDIITEPIPVIDDLGSGIDALDPVPALFGGDDIVSLIDLAALRDKFTGGEYEEVIEALGLIILIRNIANSITDDGKINIGDLSLTSTTTPEDILAGFSGLLGSDILNEVNEFVRNSDFFDSLPADMQDSFSGQSGFSMPLLDDPTNIIKLLLNERFGDVTLVEFDLPNLELGAVVDLFLPLLGPLGLTFTGGVAANFDVIVGYDTSGFRSGTFTDGFFLRGPRDDNGIYSAFGALNTEVRAGVALKAVIIDASVSGGINYVMEGFIDNGIVHFNDLDTCFVDPLTGKSTVDVKVELEIGFGPFKYTQSIPLASAVLADFDAIDCPPHLGEPTSPDGRGLATIPANGFPADQLVLNTGDRAGVRQLNGGPGHQPVTGTDVGEFYIVRYARDVVSDGPLPNDTVYGAPITNALDITGFGVTQRYGGPANPINLIVGNLGAGNDSLVLDPDVAIGARVTGGQGSDFMSGGAARDEFDGGTENDYLIGNGGNDLLVGGAGLDTLDGGVGADELRGGSERDTVSYERATDIGRGVEFSYQPNGQILGHYGDAEGDVLDNIEAVIGTRYRDVLLANPLGSPADGSMLDGRDGNDILLGVDNKGDYLLGGAGGDHMDGKGGLDGTSYFYSGAGVHIDMQRRIFTGGDATGDNLISIENVQGSGNPDVIFGDGSANIIDGFIGNDRLSGGGGQDQVWGGHGDDVIFAFGDGDTLDGGGSVGDPGRDLLTYEVHTEAVTVNLRTNDGGGNDALVAAAGVAGYSTFENLTGANVVGAGDSLTGDDRDNVIRGLAGNDALNGGHGADLLEGGAGADAMTGGTGFDMADYRSSGGGVRVDLLAGGLDNDAQGDSFSLAAGQRVEDLRGSDHTDVLKGDEFENLIDPGLSGTNTFDDVDGREGHDILYVDYSRGLSGKGVVGGFADGSISSGALARQARLTSDVLDGVQWTSMERLILIGTSQADEIYGGQSHDTILTGHGDDIILAGRGHDVVDAGAGNDTVAFGTNAERDLVEDPLDEADLSGFSLNGGSGIDKLRLSLVDANEDVFIIAIDTGASGGGNMRLQNGAGVTGFEILEHIVTGDGNDTVWQVGGGNNTFSTGFGDDRLLPGLGIDVVDGGHDDTGIVGQPGDTGPFLNFEYFARNGDLLDLDYISVQGFGIVSQTVAVHIGVIFGSDFVDTNNGYYRGDGTTAESLNLDLTFSEIERISVRGSNQNDMLSGTLVAVNAGYEQQLAVNPHLKGDDLFFGEGGDDWLIGYSGDDDLHGGEGDDILEGGYLFGRHPAGRGDQYEVDTLTGDAGADVFMLGAELGSFYEDGLTESTTPSHARIMDFTPGDGDVIQLWGSAASYSLVQTAQGSTQIYHRNFPGEDDQYNDLIAEVQNFTGFNLNAGYVVYVDENNPSPFVFSTSAASSPFASSTPMAAAPAPETLASGAGGEGEAVAAFASVPGFSVTEQNDPNTLLAGLGTMQGISNARLTVEGDAQASGTFDGGPFGLGAGIVLSTGRVEDLVGPNTPFGSEGSPAEVSVSFDLVGRVGQSNILVADLSNIGFDLRSLILTDSGSRVGGGGGVVSGFDLDSVILSRHKLTAAELTSPDVVNNLERINVFNFSANGTYLTPGEQTDGPPTGFSNDRDLSGHQNGILLANRATLDEVDSTLDTLSGAVTLGHGGKIAFDLTDPVDTSGPLYLYIAEGGGVGEALTGLLRASSAVVEPQSDLSTDLGAEGLSGDTSRMTYAFTPDAGMNQIEFEFVIFSEELPNFAGDSLYDLFSIKLNGVDLATLSDGKSADLFNLMATTYGPSHPDLILNAPITGPAAAQTRTDSYTTVLKFTGPAIPGIENVLELKVTDRGDAFLDSGILLKAGSFKASVASHFEFGGSAGGVLVEGGPPGSITVKPPSGGEGGTVILDPSDNIDLGNGPGVPVPVVFTPGDTNPREIPVTPVPDAPPGPAIIDVTVESNDPDIDDQPVPPYVFEIIDPIDVPENTTAVATLTASGASQGVPLTWAVTGGVDAGLFQVNASGELSFINPPDYENPGDVGEDNLYDVIVTASTADGTVVDDQHIAVNVTDVSESSTMKVTFVSEEAGYRNTFGWYDTRTGKGEILFGSIEAQGHKKTVQPGVSTATFDVAANQVPYIAYFLIPDGGNQNSAHDLSGEVQVIQLPDGKWAVVPLDEHGNIETHYGKPEILCGTGLNAMFTETAKNPGGVDYASSIVGSAQTAASLAGDIADGPGGLLAWEDTAAARQRNGTYGQPGDADYNDAVFQVVEIKGQTLFGTNNGEPLTGGLAADFLFGRGGDDTLKGDGGDDMLDGGTGADHMSGGVGDDTYIVDHVGDAVVEKTDAGTDTVITSLASYTLGPNVENLTYSGSAAFAGTGNGLANILKGGEEDDTLNGLGGADVMIGLGGDDTYVVDNTQDKIVEEANAGIDLVQSSVSHTLGANVENLTLTGTGSIDGTGNSLANALTGNSKSNVLKGEGGADLLWGGGGADDLYAGADSVRDVFVFSSASDSGRGSSSNWDKIFQFDHSAGAGAATSDVIDLRLLDADPAAGDQAFRFVSNFTTAPAGQSKGQVRAVDDGAHVKVEIDLGGDDVADMIIQVRNIDMLTASDFLL